MCRDCHFIGAASSGKAWAVSASPERLVFTMALYIAGNLIMLRLLRKVGMTTAFSISAVLQLVAINLVAIFVYGEWASSKATGIVLAVAALALITFAPHFGQ
jgi:glucose uptake protein GlcU